MSEEAEELRFADVSLYLWSFKKHRVVDVCHRLQDVKRHESDFIELITTLPPALR